MIAALVALAPILAGLAGLVPAFLQYMTMRSNNAKDIELQKLQIEAASKGYSFQLAVAEAATEAKQQEHIYSFASGPSGVRWVDAWAIIVRPGITTFMFLLWSLMKVAVFVAAVNNALDLAQVIGVVWTDTDKAIFGSIMGFWFGNRGGDYYMKANAPQIVAQGVTAAKVMTPATRATIIPAPGGDRS